MKKIILVLSLLFSLWGIFASFYFVFFSFEDFTKFQNFLIFNGKPYHYSGMNIFVVIERTSEYSYKSTSIALLNLFFYLTFLAGSLIYYFSKYKESKLLVFNYSLNIFKFYNKNIGVYCFFRY